MLYSSQSAFSSLPRQLPMPHSRWRRGPIRHCNHCNHIAGEEGAPARDLPYALRHKPCPKLGQGMGVPWNPILCSKYKELRAVASHSPVTLHPALTNMWQACNVQPSKFWPYAATQNPYLLALHSHTGQYRHDQDVPGRGPLQVPHHATLSIWQHHTLPRKQFPFPTTEERLLKAVQHVEVAVWASSLVWLCFGRRFAKAADQVCIHCTIQLILVS